MKIEITRPTRVDGQSCAPGDVIDTDRKTAELLLSMRKAKTPDKARAKPEKAPE